MDPKNAGVKEPKREPAFPIFDFGIVFWTGSGLNKEAAAVASLYTEDAVRLKPNAPALVGREAIRGAYQGDFDLYKNEEADSIEDVRVFGDLAFARGTYANKSVFLVPDK